MPATPHAPPIRLRIIALEGDLPEVRVATNPREVRWEKTVTWARHESSWGDHPHVDFRGGNGRTVSMELVFGATGGQSSVEPITLALLRLAELRNPAPGAPEDEKRPPRIALQWTNAAITAVEGVITSVNVRYTDFAADGSPIKAIVALTVLEASRASVAGPA